MGVQALFNELLHVHGVRKVALCFSVEKESNLLDLFLAPSASNESKARVKSIIKKHLDFSVSVFNPKKVPFIPPLVYFFREPFPIKLEEISK